MASCRRSASRATSLRLRPVRLARRASSRFRSGSKRIVRAELFMSDNVIQAAPPNKRLKVTGGDRSERSVVPLTGHGLRPTTLRRRASRPQLTREPLGHRHPALEGVYHTDAHEHRPATPTRTSGFRLLPRAVSGGLSPPDCTYG